MIGDKDELRKISDEELKGILVLHRLWLDSKGAEGERADLSKCHLGRAHLEGVNHRRAHLEKVHLGGAHPEGADLTDAHLERVDLQATHLEQANLQSADLDGADLSAAHLEAASLSGALLKGASLWAAHLEGANLQGAYLDGAYLLGAYLEGADVTDAHLEGANLQSTNLKGAHLARAHLKEVNLSGAHLEGADLRQVNLNGVNVTGVTYNRKGRFRGIRVEGCYGSPLFKRFAQDQDFIEELREGTWRKKAIYYLWNVFADCGRTPWAWVAWSLVFAFYFGVVFYIMGPVAFHVREPLPFTLGTMIYYSVVTFTTLGFGDITPRTTEAAWWVMSEVIVGYVMLGGLISILATKLARRS